MTRNQVLKGIPAGDPRPLQMAAGASRRRGRILAFLSMALLAGMIGGLVWMKGPELGSLELLPQDPTAEEQIAQAATDTPTPDTSPAPDAAVERAAGQAQGVDVTPPIGAPNPALLRSVDLRTVVAPPSPTPTRTPLPPVDSVEAVVGSGGATLWEASSGLQVTQVAQGELITVTARSADSQWLYAATAEGATGWVEAERVIAFDSKRLAVQDVVVMPITPTPGAAGDMAWLTPTPAARQTGQPAVPPNAPMARVTVDDARLNIRRGPSIDASIFVKVDPGARLIVLGRSATGEWLQVMLPDGSASGWVSAEFVELSVALDDLPIVDGTSQGQTEQTLPPPSNDLDTTKGGEARPRTGVALQVAQQPAPVLYPTAAPPPTAVPQAQATGLQGTLAIQTTWGGDIYLYDLASGGLRLLTGGFDPAISPDGKQVAFTRAGGEHGLYLVNVDGSNERLIFSGRELLRSPKWSPDGQYIVFERGDEVLHCWETGNRCIPRPPFVDKDELSTERQEKLARVDVNGQNYQDLPVLQRAHAPDWNEAGIVYHSPAGIQLTQDDPGSQTELVFFNITKQYELDPDWQPGGGRIVFQRREADHWEIYGVNPDGSGLFALTKPGFTLVDKMPSNVAPAWSPDGQHIVFLSNRQPDHNAGAWGVWVMDAGGGDQRRLPIDLDFTYTYVAEQMLDWGP
ncbi:MAG: PD40 domain-containing protein [Caldilineaceae bacterium]|nr:PD40 domain-containing protein [Caldilineaceae bacterium]